MMSLHARRTIAEAKRKTKYGFPWKVIIPNLFIGQRATVQLSKTGTSTFEFAQQPFHCWALWLVKISILGAIAFGQNSGKPKRNHRRISNANLWWKTFYVNGANAWFEREKQMQNKFGEFYYSNPSNVVDSHTTPVSVRRLVSASAMSPVTKLP